MKSNIKIKIKRFDKSIPLPSYKTDGAVAFDLYTRETAIIKPKAIELIPLNIALSLPKGYFTLLVCRSSTFKLGITCANGLGVIDSDYNGDNDELLFPAMNITNKEITIEKGTRCCQLLIFKSVKGEITEVQKLKNRDRGGFGTTGKS